jgi:hypothetical protein
MRPASWHEISLQAYTSNHTFSPNIHNIFFALDWARCYFLHGQEILSVRYTATRRRLFLGRKTAHCIMATMRNPVPGNS